MQIDLHETALCVREGVYNYKGERQTASVLRQQGDLTTTKGDLFLNLYFSFIKIKW